MEQQNSLNETANKNKIIVSFDEFNISEDSFRPMTKGLGFHQDNKRQNSFKSAPKEIKPYSPSSTNKSKSLLLNEISIANKEMSSKSAPAGLEAFYGAPPVTHSTNEDQLNSMSITNLEKKVESQFKIASSATQFFAWLIDLLMISCFSLVTTLVLILVSGMSFKAFMRVVPTEDLLIFGSVLFSLYYLLYFTILDLGSTPGKTILGIRLVTSDNKAISVRHTFVRSLVSLLSFIALLLPNIIDFQGRLSDTKLVK